MEVLLHRKPVSTGNLELFFFACSFPSFILWKRCASVNFLFLWWACMWAQILMCSGTVVFEIYALSLAIVSFSSCKESAFFLTNSYRAVLLRTNN